MNQMWAWVGMGVHAEEPSFYLLLALGKILESHWLSIVIQVRALNWQPQKLPKQWAGQVVIDPSSLLNQIVSKSSVPCSMLIQSSVWPQCKNRKKERKTERNNEQTKEIKTIWLILYITTRLGYNSHKLTEISELMRQVQWRRKKQRSCIDCLFQSPNTLYPVKHNWLFSKSALCGNQAYLTVYTESIAIAKQFMLWFEFREKYLVDLEGRRISELRGYDKTITWIYLFERHIADFCFLKVLCKSHITSVSE